MLLVSAQRGKMVLILFLGVASVNVAGCTTRDSPPLQKVQGTVKYHGKFLDHGRVTFLPEEGVSGSPATGVIQTDGSYRLQSNEQDGAVEGKYRVLVQCRQLSPPSQTLRPVLLPSLIPIKYADEKGSPLSIEVKAGVREYALVLE